MSIYPRKELADSFSYESKGKRENTGHTAVGRQTVLHWPTLQCIVVMSLWTVSSKDIRRPLLRSQNSHIALKKLKDKLISIYVQTLLRQTLKGRLSKREEGHMLRSSKGILDATQAQSSHTDDSIRVEKQNSGLARWGPQVCQGLCMCENQQGAGHCTNTSLINSHNSYFYIMKIRKQIWWV